MKIKEMKLIISNKKYHPIFKMFNSLEKIFNIMKKHLFKIIRFFKIIEIYIQGIKKKL